MRGRFRDPLPATTPRFHVGARGELGRKRQPSPSTGTRHPQTRLWAPAARSRPDARPLPPVGLGASRTRPACSPPSHHSPKSPPAHPVSPTPSPQPPSTVASTNNSFFHLRGKKIQLLPSRPARRWLVGRSRGWRARPALGPSIRPPVRLSVRPAAALLRALTSALPAAGRWAGGTAPIVLKIIQRSTNSLQISVTARRN